MDDLLAGENNICTSILEDFKFVCLRGQFEGSELKKLMYVNEVDGKDQSSCVMNFAYPQKFDKENWCRLISRIGLSRNAISPKKMIIDGKTVEVTFENGPLLNSGESIYFDPLCIAVNLQKSGSNVIFNFDSKDVMYFLFIKSDYFGDENWHFDDRGDGNFYESSTYISSHYKTEILTYGLKVFMCCGNIKNFDNMYDRDYEYLDDDWKMKFLREKGFCELELHEIKYCDPSKQPPYDKVPQSRKVFLTPDFFNQENIDKSLMYDFTKTMGRINKPAIFYGAEYTDKERDQKWEELKKNSVIVPANAKIVNISELTIDKKSFFGFLDQNLDGFSNSNKIKFGGNGEDFSYDYAITLTLNGKNDVRNEKIFNIACNDIKVDKITLDCSEDIYQCSLKVANAFDNADFINEVYASDGQGNKEKTTSAELVLKKYPGEPILLYKGKKTNIKVEVHQKAEILVKMNGNGNLELWQGNKKLDVNLTADNTIQNLISQNNKISLKDKISNPQGQNLQSFGHIPNQSSINSRNGEGRNFYK